MIRQVSVDIEIPDEKYDKMDNEDIAKTIEDNLDLNVIAIDTTAVWKNLNDYKHNIQL